MDLRRRAACRVRSIRVLRRPASRAEPPNRQRLAARRARGPDPCAGRARRRDVPDVARGRDMAVAAVRRGARCAGRFLWRAGALCALPDRGGRSAAAARRLRHLRGACGSVPVREPCGALALPAPAGRSGADSREPCSDRRTAGIDTVARSGRGARRDRAGGAGRSRTGRRGGLVERPPIRPGRCEVSAREAVDRPAQSRLAHCDAGAGRGQRRAGQRSTHEAFVRTP